MKYLLSILLVISISVSSFAQDNDELNIGDKVPNFSTLDENGDVWESSKISTDFLVIYFYPAAMTGGCTKQACAYRDAKASFDQLNATIVGVSGDEFKNLKHFKDSYQLNFPLLSDNEGTISKNFGVPTRKGGSIEREIGGENFMLTRGITTPRWTFVLDKNRNIIYKNMQVNAVEDSKNVQEIIKKHS